MTKKTDMEIDQIVDDLVRDEATAKALKSKLHDDETQAKATTQVTSPYARADAGEDDDDLWDNLPV